METIAEDQRLVVKARLHYYSLPPFFRQWVDKQNGSGLCGRDMNIIIARDALRLAKRLKSVGAIREWSRRRSLRAVRLHGDHTASSLRRVVQLAEESLIVGLTGLDCPPVNNSDEGLSGTLMTWVARHAKSGRVEHKMVILIAHEAMRLASIFKSSDQLERWAQDGLDETYHVRLNWLYVEVPLRTVVQLAKSELSNRQPRGM